jgi:hypothetical protein
MLNMLFDHTQTQGLFSDLVTAGSPLLTSKRWLRGNVGGGGPQQDPTGVDPHNAAIWLDLERFNVLIPKNAAPGNGHRIRIRIAPIPRVAPQPILPPLAPGDAWVIDYAVAFGRPPVGGGQHASPFVDPANPTLIKTTFLDKNVAADIDSSGNVKGWIIDLGRIGNNAHPTGPGGAARSDLTNRYEFSLGVVLKKGTVATSSFVTHAYYGEDPEEDVGG